MIETIIGALREVGVEASAREIAEIIWLAAALGEDVPRRAVDNGGEAESALHWTSAPDDVEASVSAQLLSSPAPRRDRVPLFSAERDATGTGATRITTSAPPPLPGGAAIAAALRPLKRRVASPYRAEIDEAASVERIAETGIMTPVLRPVAERWLDVALVVEESRSMRLWRPMIGHFQRLLENQGLFRDVRTCRMVAGKTGVELFRAAATNGAAIDMSPRRIVQRRGRTAVMIVSDTLGDGWRNGTVARTVRAWSRTSSVVLVQVLPPALWPATPIGSPRAAFSSRAPGRPNARLTIELERDRRTDGATALPVVTLDEWSIGPWAALVAGKRDARAPGVMLAARVASAVAADLADDAVGGDAAGMDPRELVASFRASASVTAYTLATYLASAPLTLPVMRLVQHVMLPSSRQSHLAEVFLSGLLEQRTRDDDTDEDTILYDFSPGVRDVLLVTSPADQARRVLNASSVYVEAKTGIATMTALVPSAEARDAELPALATAFAEVAERVLSRIGAPVTMPAVAVSLLDAPAVAVPRLEAPAAAPRVQVAGTGFGALPPEHRELCEVLGRRLAREGYHLVVGDWSGVDEAVMTAFVAELDERLVPERLTQFVDVRVRRGPVVELGRVVTRSADDSFDARDSVDALMLISGLGGAYRAYESLLGTGKPVLPFAMTDGDAAKVYEELMESRRSRRVLDRGALRLLLGSVDGDAIPATVDGALALLRLALDPKTAACYEAFHRSLLLLMADEPSPDIASWMHLYHEDVRTLFRDVVEASNRTIDLPPSAFDPSKTPGSFLLPFPVKPPDLSPDRFASAYDDIDDMGRWVIEAYRRLMPLDNLWPRARDVRSRLINYLAAAGRAKFKYLIRAGAGPLSIPVLRELFDDAVRLNRAAQVYGLLLFQMELGAILERGSYATSSRGGSDLVFIQDVPEAGTRWQQGNITKGIWEGYFHLNEPQRITLYAVDDNGSLGRPEIRRRGKRKVSGNFHVEIGVAPNAPYPSNGPPIRAVVPVGDRRYVYMLLMPGDTGYARAHEVLNRFNQSSTKRRRALIPRREAEAAWPESPLWAAAEKAR